MSKKEFVVKSADEIQALIEGEKFEELAEYYNKKNEHTRQEMQGLIDAKASKEDVQKVSDALREDITKQMHSINEALKAQGMAIRKIAQSKSDNTPQSFKANLAEKLKEKMPEIKAMRSGWVDFEVKAPATMLESSHITGELPQAEMIPGLNAVASRRVRLLDIMMSASTSSNLIKWVYQANKDGTAGQTAEGAAKNQIDFDMVVVSEEVRKTTAYIKVSDEMLDDISWIQSEINNELMRELLKAVETQAYSGDNTGQNLNGVRTTATAFAAGTFADTVDNANAVDVLTVAINQVKIADQEGPNYILMHPSDVTALKLVKLSATDKRYVDRLITVGSTLVLDGVPIIETTLVTVDDYLVGNFNLAHLVTKDGIRIEMGLDADDFTKNLRTIRAEWRGLVYVKNNDRTAFIAGDFSTDAAALETP